MARGRFALLIEYDGTNFAGWQRQANAPSVQGALEEALSVMCKEKVTLIGCSRTDAGVHARMHVSHFEADCRVPVEKLPIALGTLLPEDIAVIEAAKVGREFHARFSPIGKQYSYYIWNNRRKSGLLHRYSVQEGRPLDLEAMREAAKLLLGKHDFRVFMAAGSSAKTTERTLYKLEVSGEPGGLLRICVAGDGFLYNMVRIISGTLLYVGLGKLGPEDIGGMLEKGHRPLAGKTLPPQGLFLDEVYYAEWPFKACYNKPNHLLDLLQGEETETV